jgi:hypothetical protein
MQTGRRRTALTAAALTATVAATALALTACGPTGSSGSSHRHAKHGSVTSGGTGHHTAWPVSTGTPRHPAPPATATGAGTATASRTPAPTPRCHSKDVAVSFATGGDAAPDTRGTAQTRAVVMVRNSSGHTCAIGGFPGVDLKGGGADWPLARSGAAHGRITLAPGDSTDFAITFLPEPGGAWTPETVTVTPPDETLSKTLAWPYGPVLRQDAATHPGTYTGPIG